MRKGICVAGNMIVDILYPIEGWPRQGELVHIKDGISRSTGGAVCNVLMDLAALDPELPLQAMGKNGEDAEGDLILERLGAYPNIDTSNVLREGISAHTLVMSDVKAGQRTFFTYPGANGRFDENCVDWDNVRADILHIGYILLLNALDQPDEEFGSKLARLLCHAQQRGIRTSVDVVSETSDRFRQLVPPAMKYADYCVINEYEAQMTTGIPLRDADGGLIRENLPAALRTMREMGVSAWAVIHAPEGGFGMGADGVYVARPSLRLPEGYIKGSVGAGDAFCAGVLYGAEQDWGLERAIDLGIAAATAALSQAGSTDGMRPRDEVLALLDKYERREI